jgi:hypothetical protein
MSPFPRSKSSPFIGVVNGGGTLGCLADGPHVVTYDANMTSHSMVTLYVLQS